MTSDYVTRIARAMDTATTGPNAGNLVIAEIFSPELWAIMSERLALAALSAAMEPDEAMIEAGFAAIPESEPCLDDAAIIFRAMIKHALEQKT